jgi:outer membrane protein OmpA-like peptidoglycan-associated protein
MRRRRQIAVVVGALAVVIAGAVIIIANRDGGDSPSTAKSSGDVTTTSAGRGAASSPSSPSTGPSGSATTAGSDGSTPVTTVPLALPEADQKAPPDPPTGLYRQGKLRLVGSVPSADVALRYQKRVEGILGRGNVTMAMQRDPRVPASPLRVIVEEEFRFPTGSISVDPKYAGLLNLGVIALKKLPEARLVVTGYTDNVGSADVNQSLSEERAQVVVDWMVRGGIPASRIQALGRGSADPIADNSTPEGRLANRRIEATLEGIQP